MSVGGPTYTYDLANRLTTVSNGNQLTTFTYDGIGRVVQIVDQVAGAVVANHWNSWCGNVRCVEVDNTVQQPAGNSQTVPLIDKVYFKQGVQVFKNASGISRVYNITDRLGSVRELVGSTASGVNSVIAQYEYDPSGNRSKVAGVGLDSDIGFAGYFHHGATGLDITRHRVYNPQLGRWLTRDPIGYGPAFPQPTEFNGTDLNFYAYVRNNPMSLRDPLGLDPCGPFGGPNPRDSGPFGGPNPRDKMLREYFGGPAPWLVRNFSLFNVGTADYWISSLEALFLKGGLIGGTNRAANWIAEAPFSDTVADFYAVHICLKWLGLRHSGPRLSLLLLWV